MKHIYSECKNINYKNNRDQRTVATATEEFVGIAATIMVTVATTTRQATREVTWGGKKKKGYLKNGF